MFVKSLYLENIRSYKSQEFSFKEGMTLLAGDIGSGKSSVLLSIEFALFGLIRGSINGASLLRHGSKDGLVRLSFIINNVFYEVERTLKKSSVGITQDKCSFSVNGSKENLTPLELKSKILNLLGYPEDLVSKSKTLIFRYTVYTPQEEMKQIIFESKDERLEKLRRIFGVDKYELIKNNASLYARDLRAELKNHKLIKEEKEFLDEKIKNVKTELGLFFEEKKDLKKEHDEFLKKDGVLKEKISVLEKDVVLVSDLKSKIRVISNDFVNFNNSFKDLGDEKSKIEEDIKLRESKIEKVPELTKGLDDIQKELDDLLVKREDFNKKVSEAKSKLAVIKNKIVEIEELLSGVEELENCPTCKQSVTSEHKCSLRDKENEKLLILKEKESKLLDVLSKADNTKIKFDEKRVSLEKEKDDLKNLIFKKKLIEQNKKVLDEKKERLTFLINKINLISKNCEDLKKKESELKKELEKYSDLDNKNVNLKNEKSASDKSLLVVEKRLSALEQSIKDKEFYLKEKEEDLSKKINDLKVLDNKKVLEMWLSNHFINLASVIEKQVLFKIHKEFNSLFKEWFSMLIDDFELDADVEQDFSLRITQNGYDSSIENLSGGEKTAVSLAYRLALNKVINDLVHDVKTKGFMILDEPTDGFSSDQLDKVRDVLEKTNTRQIILVSHEAKLESFVNNIIRINKQNHESQTIQI